jgi:hypothetical protein
MSDDTKSCPACAILDKGAHDRRDAFLLGMAYVVTTKARTGLDALCDRCHQLFVGTTGRTLGVLGGPSS